MVLLSISATIIYTFTNISLGLKFKYPIVKCQNIEKDYNVLFGDDGSTIEDADNQRWTNDAFKESMVNRAYEKEGKTTHYQGMMQCFCKFRQTQYGDMKNAEYTNEEGTKDAFCKAYSSDQTTSKILGQSVAFVIIAINTVLKIVIIKGITWVGEDTNSEQLASVTNGVFIAQFFNTGILILLVNGNLSEHQPHFLTNFVQGKFYDYQPDWYSNVGFKVVQTMIINAILPYVTLTTSFLIPALKRKVDRKFGSNVY